MKEYGDLVERARAFYEDALAKFGDDPRGVNWRDKESQTLRFEVLSGVGPLAGRRLHDVGCGLAHFHDFLAARGTDCDYVGSDISAKMVAAARKRLGDGAALEAADILADANASWMRADYVVNCGLFTVSGGTDPARWWEYCRAVIGRMFELSHVGIAFNMMTSHVDYRDDHLFYAKPGDVVDFCADSLSRRVVLRHDYPLYEFTVYVYR